MINQILDEAKVRMEKSYAAMCSDFNTMRVGRANPAILDGITVDYYGTPTPINQTANINIADARMLTIQPWDKKLIGAIEKAIQKSELGINPTNDGEMIRLAIPQLTEERRKELVKTAKKRAEEAKVAIRNIRRDAINEIDKLEDISEDIQKGMEKDIQSLTDEYNKKIEELLKEKEKELMTV